MIVEKNGKQYVVNETKNGWSVVWKSGAVEATFKIPKDICQTEEDVKAYIQTQSMF